MYVGVGGGGEQGVMQEGNDLIYNSKWLNVFNWTILVYSFEKMNYAMNEFFINQGIKESFLK